MTRSVDTALLRTFLEVCATRHFGRAAEQLYLTQSAVSFRIRQLEELLGVKLFERHRHNIMLTAAGERLVPYARAMLETWEQAQESVAAGDDDRPQLAVGAPSALLDAVLEQPLVQAAEQVDGLRLRVESGPLPTLLRSVTAHELDAALLTDRPKAEELNARPLAEMEFRLFASQAPCSSEALPRLPHVDIAWGSTLESQMIQNTSRLPLCALRTTQARIALTYLARHQATAWLPATVATGPQAPHALFEVTGVAPVRQQLFLACRHDHPQPELLQQFADLLVSHLGTEDGDGDHGAG